MSTDILSRVPDAFHDVVQDFDLLVKPTVTIRILVVVERMFSLRPGPNRFGIGSAIQHIRETDTGDYRFQVDLAMRPANRDENPSTNPDPTPHEPKFNGFRFDQHAPNSLLPLINNYHEIWCFGWNPGNNPNPVDADITNPDNSPLTESELKVLTLWMNNKKGGLFATGDHDYLGASLCSSIPRVGTMRKWMHTHGVPSIKGADRLDTNRPLATAQSILDLIPDTAEEDAIPQQISWVSWGTGQFSTNRSFDGLPRPHPVLCHPIHGPINVMPDHPHEGLCFDTMIDPLTGRPEIKLDGTYNFSGSMGEDYPTVNGFKPTPMVIAYGTTLPDPPYNHEKGDSPEKKFPMISVYDGHTIDIGRVVVDSTWHHWFDMNIWTMKNAADKTNWEKISQYYVNLALWLIPPLISKNVLTGVMFRSQFEYFGLELMSPEMSVFEIGRTFKTYWQTVGSCWVTQFVLDWVKVSDNDLHGRLIKEYFEPKPELPSDPLGLSRPPFELIEDAVLGGMALQAHEMTDPIRRGTGGTKSKKKKIKPAEFEKQLIAGGNRGLNIFLESLDKSLKTSRNTLLSNASK